MNRTILPGAKCGTVAAPASKSQAHRLLIAAALGQAPVTLYCDGISKDIAATAACLRSLGADIQKTAPGVIRITPIQQTPSELCHLPCGESGSTLRFLLPVVGAMGAQAVFHREGRLPQRPLGPLAEELLRHGMQLTPQGDDLLCCGRITAGAYSLPGNESSQYISGLLLALPLLPGESILWVTGSVESADYIAMTEDTLRKARISFVKQDNQYHIPGGQRCCLPSPLQVEGDWSSAAFFLCGGALSRSGITVSGLAPSSVQGDRAVVDLLRQFGAQVDESGDRVTVRRGTLHGCKIDARPIPDLIPVISVVAALAEGETHIHNAGRLRLKESDRLESTCRMLQVLGAEAQELPDGLVIRGKPCCLSGGTVDSYRDHRIAMAAAVAAMGAKGIVTVTDSQCTDKSYPAFWNHLSSLKGDTP